MCVPAPVAERCWADAQARWGSRVTFLGIVGDQAHSVRQSGHNCASAPGGQESPIDGVGYAPGFAHALDLGHGGDRELATEIRQALLADRRTRYVIDNGTVYYPAHRGGGTSPSSGHESHIHWSGMPGSTYDTRPFFTNTDGGFTVDAEAKARFDAIERKLDTVLERTAGQKKTITRIWNKLRGRA